MTASDARPSHTLDLNANALTVLERRYLVKDDHGKPVEKPEDLFLRVARTIAAPDATYGASARAVESLAETFFELMARRVWMPNSPTLMNAGRPLRQLSACLDRKRVVWLFRSCLGSGRREPCRDVLRAHGPSCVDAQFSHPDERRPPPRPAVRLLRSEESRVALPILPRLGP